MKDKSLNNLLSFSLFGSGLGFYGMLYEGLVYGPKMLDYSAQRLHFWRDFYTNISPVIYYIPFYPLSIIAMAALCFTVPAQKLTLKRSLIRAAIFQVASFVCTIYILALLHLKMYFGNPELYVSVIPGKVVLFNVLSVLRIVLSGIALLSIFKSYFLSRQS